MVRRKSDAEGYSTRSACKPNGIVSSRSAQACRRESQLPGAILFKELGQ
jgi:hypothetical protein